MGPGLVRPGGAESPGGAASPGGAPSPGGGVDIKPGGGADISPGGGVDINPGGGGDINPGGGGDISPGGGGDISPGGGEVRSAGTAGTAGAGSGDLTRSGEDAVGAALTSGDAGAAEPYSESAAMDGAGDTDTGVSLSFCFSALTSATTGFVTEAADESPSLAREGAEVEVEGREAVDREITDGVDGREVRAGASFELGVDFCVARVFASEEVEDAVASLMVRGAPPPPRVIVVPRLDCLVLVLLN